MKYIELTCPSCLKLYQKKAKYVTLALKKGKNKFYCSAACVGIANISANTTIENCAKCGKEIKARQSVKSKSKSGNVFCSRKCSAAINNTIYKSGSNHPNWKDGKGLTYRTKVRIQKCEGCGEDRKYLLCIHHRDGDRKNPAAENLEVVCYNCHALRHLEEVDGEIRFKTSILTTPELKLKLNLSVA